MEHVHLRRKLTFFFLVTKLIISLKIWIEKLAAVAVGAVMESDLSVGGSEVPVSRSGPFLCEECPNNVNI